MVERGTESPGAGGTVATIERSWWRPRGRHKGSIGRHSGSQRPNYLLQSEVTAEEATNRTARNLPAKRGPGAISDDRDD